MATTVKKAPADKLVYNKHNKIKGRLSTRVTDWIIYLILGLLALCTVAPFLYVTAGSLATEKELTERAFFVIPKVISFNAYQYIWKTGTIFRGLRNSLFVTIFGTIINMIFTTTFAYPLSKKDFKGRNLILNLVIVTMLFSGGMIPSYLLIRNLGWLDSYLALTVPGAISAFNMIIVKNFFQELPIELEEAARIDGCNDIGIFRKIVLPLSKPVLASIGLFYAVGHWNDYFGSMIYLNTNSKYTVQMILRQIVLMAQGIQTDGTMIDYNMAGPPPDQSVKMAATVVATLPILLVYPFLQKHFAKGVMVGSVKG
ncbi:MAG: carbohydrate ABC transporter permease [Clostridiales bacterium]|nr:carbohydrate ABC transporter permease [Clostridiales bacterium]